MGTGPVTTYLNGPGGLLATDAGATPTYPLTNAHGDIVGTTGVTGTFTPTPATDAFGVSTGAPPASGLGYLGNAERFTTGGALDLISMGVRLYDPSLGRFLQPDPVPGGSANAYDYCFQDPINCFDLAGTFGFKSFFKKLHQVISPLVQVLQTAAVAAAVLDAVPGLQFVSGVVDAAAFTLGTIDAGAQCVSGEVKAGGCAVLIASVALGATGFTFARGLEDVGLEGKALGKAAVAVAAIRYGFGRAADKLAHVGRG